jgi:hypothetical protein
LMLAVYEKWGRSIGACFQTVDRLDCRAGFPAFNHT